MANCGCGQVKNSNGSVCLECEVPQAERIRYFTGRMMAARDFSDEQRYHIGKARRHNQLLHGSGVACGLKVKQHDNPECRDHYVIVEPGMAIDCCGRELLLNSETVFDFRKAYQDWLHAQKGPDCPMDSDQHVLQIAARYGEYPTEEVPLLFEACATGDTASAPSRVREIIEMGVVVDPETVTNQASQVALKWRHTLTVERPIRVAIDEKQSKVYVLAGRHPSKLYVFRMENDSLIDAQVLGGRGVDLALSADGHRAYVALDAKDHEGMFVEVLDTTHLGEHHAVVARIPIGSPPGSSVRLAVSPADGALFVLNARARQVLVYDNTINHHGVDPHDALRGKASVGYRPTDIVVTPDGNHVVVANRDGHDLTVFSPHRLHHTVTVEMPDAVPYGLAAAYAEGRMRLFVSDRDGQALWMLVSVPDDEHPFAVEGKPLSLKPYRPVDMLVAPSGRWLYLLVEGDEDRGRVQVADIYAWTKQGADTGEPLAALEIEAEIEEEEEEREEEEEEEEREHRRHREEHEEEEEEEEEGEEDEEDEYRPHHEQELEEHEHEEEEEYEEEDEDDEDDEKHHHHRHHHHHDHGEQHEDEHDHDRSHRTQQVLGMPVPVGREPVDLALAGREGRLYTKANTRWKARAAWRWSTWLRKTAWTCSIMRWMHAPLAPPAAIGWCWQPSMITAITRRWMISASTT